MIAWNHSSRAATPLALRQKCIAGTLVASDGPPRSRVRPKMHSAPISER